MDYSFFFNIGILWFFITFIFLLFLNFFLRVSLFILIGIIYLVLLVLLVCSNSSPFGSSETNFFLWFNFDLEVPVYFNISSNVYTNEFSFILILLALIIHFYSFFYFKKDPDFARFTLLIGFFLFFMLLLINTGSWIFLFVSWEGVGLLSFLLVSFWYSKVNTFKSGIKVLLYNRIGDFFLFISIGLLEFFLKVDGFSNTSYLMPLLSNNSINFGSYILLEFILGFSLMAVILSKSAQFGFHIWLLEAMEAPLPASSLIHSATLVCAGIVLFFKSFNFILYSSYITSFIIFWSSLTACFLSASALLNYDIKKILAYSTGSHVSLMLILSISSGGSLGYAYTLVHASIKVFIFLLFGFIIDANQGIRDIRKMGGFFRFQDITYYGFFAICSLSSLPFFPLAFLKDIAGSSIMNGSFIHDTSLFFLMLATVFNYLYMFRLFFKIFFGDLLSVNNTYFNYFFIFFKKIGVVFKGTGYIFWKNPLFILFFFSFFFEISILFFMGVDFGFSENRILFVNNYTLSNSTLKYLSYSNTLFFFFILIKTYNKIFK